MHTSIWLLIAGLVIIFLFLKLAVDLFLVFHQHHHVKVREKTSAYKSAGLSDSDIKIFRETMKEAVAHIEKWDRAVKVDNDISVIEDLTGGLESSKRLFKMISNNPKELTKQNDFLYQDLPNMTKLLETFEALQNGAVKANKEKERDLAEILLLIKTLSNTISKRYHDLLMKDVSVIGKEIANASK